MKRIKSIVTALAAVVLIVSCGKEVPVVEYLEVTPNNVAGEWTLQEWNGEQLEEGSYFFMELVRKDKKFTIYQNFDSMSDMPHIVTGEYNLDKTDVELGAIINGMYDYDEGFWAHEYNVRKLTETSMEWIAVDDPTFVQVFVRCSIPEELKK